MTFSVANRGHDVSAYQGAINFFRMVESGARFVIFRASYGNKKDLKFDEYMAGSSGLLPIAAYHYYDPIYSPAVQAAKTIEALAPYKARITRLWIDLEYEWTGGYMNPVYWMAYRNLLNEAGYKTGIYTRATWWDSRVGSYDFTRDPMWAAQYSSALTLIPKGWTSAMIWQKGALIYDAGQSSQKIDYDIWNDAYNFETEWGTSPVAIVDGYQKIRRYNSDVHIWRGAASLKVTDNGGILVRPSSFAGDVVINGDGWTPQYPYLPYSLSVSNGTSVQAVQRDYRPFINSRADGSMVVSGTDKANAYNLVSGTRYSVKAGLNAFVLSLDPEHVTERHPRTAIGYTQDGRLIACVVDGRSTISAGVTLYELANIMIEAGAWWALELDGGDSSIILVDGFKKSNNGDLVNGVRTERATVNSVIFTIGETMTIIGTAKSTTHDLTIRDVHQVTGSTSRGRIPMNTTVNVTEIWQAVNTVSGVNNAGDVWALIVYGINTGWVGLKHLGVVYGVYTPAPVVPPPPVTFAHALDVTLDGVVVYHKDFN